MRILPEPIFWPLWPSVLTYFDRGRQCVHDKDDRRERDAYGIVLVKLFLIYDERPRF